MDVVGEFYCDLDEQSHQEDQVRLEPRYHTVLLDDDYHTYDYVIQMLSTIFGYSREKGYQLACEVDCTGRVIVYTGSKSEAEQKRDAILTFGPDGRIPRCAGSMNAIVEPTPG